MRARHLLAVVYGCQQRIDAALEVCRSLSAAGDSPSKICWRVVLGLIQVGEAQKAVPLLQQILTVDPGDRRALRCLDTLRGNLERLPRESVQQMFDLLAERFEDHLVNSLHYHAPRDLAALLVRHCARARPWDVLDLGCGTGLAGASIAPHARLLDGVDLSPGMLAEARRRGLYRTLQCLDLEELLEVLPPSSYDVVVAADVFPYIGRLDEVMGRTSRALRERGLLAFTVESDGARQATKRGYRLEHLTGRYRHSDPYLDALAARCGFCVAVSQRTALRLERGKAIEGRLCVWEVQAGKIRGRG